MPEVILSDYFYGDESEQFSYYRLPRLLVTGQRFKNLSTDAKLLYGLLLDRMSLSAKHGWYDEQGRVYIYYTLEEIQADMNCGHEKAVKLLAELDASKGFGLIERVKQGQGRPTKIYVKRFTSREKPPQPPATQDIPRLPIFGSQDFGKTEVQKSEKQNSLTPELQQMVEEKKLPVHTAADLSYLKKEEQTAVADAIKKEDKVPSGSQAVELKKASQEGKLTTEKIEKAVAPTKREETPPLKITLTEEDLRPYFPDKRTTIPDVKRGVFEALDLRKKALERQRAKIQAEKDPKKKSEPAR